MIVSHLKQSHIYKKQHIAHVAWILLEVPLLVCQSNVYKLM